MIASLESPALIDAYDTALFDLDGVVYLGEQPAAPRVAQSLNRLDELGKTVMYLTNNAARPATAVVEQLRALGIRLHTDAVLTSAQVAVSALVKELSPQARVLVCGSANLAALLAAAGFQIVESATENPDAVIQGYDPNLNWRRLDEATLAIQRGARWYATNPDASRPTERGLVPGVGGAIAAISTAIGGAPKVFGKPYRPMLIDALNRTRAKRAIFVGDRLDTDILGANAVGIDSLLVFSGTHGKADLLAASETQHPSCIGPDVSALLEPKRVVEVAGGSATCRGQIAVVSSGSVAIQTHPTDQREQFDALWAVAQLAWQDPRLDHEAALSVLDLLP